MNMVAGRNTASIIFHILCFTVTSAAPSCIRYWVADCARIITHAAIVSGKNKKGCDEHIFKMKKHLTRKWRSGFSFHFSDDAWLDAKINECMSEDHKAVAKDKVVAKEKAVAKIERGLRNLADSIFNAEGDTTHLQDKQREASRELVNAKNDLLAAQTDVNVIPDVDVRKTKDQIRDDISYFADLPRAQQKALCAKYVTNITATWNPVTDEYVPRFSFKIPIAEPEWEGIIQGPLPEPDGTPIRVRLSHRAIRGTESVRDAADRIKSRQPSSASSRRCCSIRSPIPGRTAWPGSRACKIGTRPAPPLPTSTIGARKTTPSPAWPPTARRRCSWEAAASRCR